MPFLALKAILERMFSNMILKVHGTNVSETVKTSGNNSALLRVVDVSVTRAQEILDTPG